MWKKRGRYQLYIPVRAGRVMQRSTMTDDRAIALTMRKIVRRMSAARRWDILDAIAARPSDPGRRTLGELYDAYRLDPRLRSFAPPPVSTRLTDHLDSWRTDLLARGRRPFTCEVYLLRVGRFIKRIEGAKRSPATVVDIDRATVKEWLGSLLKVQAGTRRQTLYALKSFIRHLIELGVLPTDPIAGLRAPPRDPPRMRYETEETDRKIVAAAKPRWQAFFAFVHATGAEVSAALRAVGGDIDLGRGVARVRGSKTATRDRHEVVIEPWAIPYLREHHTGLAPGAPVWPTYSRYSAWDHHRRVCDWIGVRDYTLRDARHSVAVRARWRGLSFEWIAAQLGHKNAYLAATCYAAFVPTSEERLAAAERAWAKEADAEAIVADSAAADVVSDLHALSREVLDLARRLQGSSTSPPSTRRT